MNDLALGSIVLAVAAVPAALLVLLLADVVKLDGAGQQQRWIRRSTAVLAVLALPSIGTAVWGWAGAAHLEPLCQAYAAPEFHVRRPINAATLRVKTIGLAADGLAPAWLASLRDPSLGLAALHRAGEPLAESAMLDLDVQRVVHHQNLWFTVSMDRFRLLDRDTGLTLAAGDELWIDAGDTRYHCGIGSGAGPTRQTEYPGGDGVARFLRRALAGPTTASGSSASSGSSAASGSSANAGPDTTR
ncbi:MAG: hypothetical protein ACKODA_10645 [Nevskiaceae bacterium]